MLSIFSIFASLCLKALKGLSNNTLYWRIIRKIKRKSVWNKCHQNTALCQFYFYLANKLLKTRINSFVQFALALSNKRWWAKTGENKINLVNKQFIGINLILSGQEVLLSKVIISGNLFTPQSAFALISYILYIELLSINGQVFHLVNFAKIDYASWFAFALWEIPINLELQDMREWS